MLLQTDIKMYGYKNALFLILILKNLSLFWNLITNE